MPTRAISQNVRADRRRKRNLGVVAASGQVFFTVEESSIVDNLVNGVQTKSANALVNVGASTIGGNGTGVLASSESIISFGNNQMSANGINGNRQHHGLR